MHLSMLSPSGGQATHKNLIAWLSRELGFCLYMMSPRWLHLELFEVYNWPLLAWGWGIVILLTKYVVPGVRNLIFFFKKCQNPHPPCLIHPTLGFTSMCELEFLGGGGYSKIRISMNFYFIFCNFEVGSSSLFIFSIKSTNLNLHNISNKSTCTINFKSFISL